MVTHDFNEAFYLGDRVGIINKGTIEQVGLVDDVFLRPKNVDVGKFVGMKNVNNISISSKNYLPIIRNRDYEKITSGGVRTLSSVGFYLSLLEYSISNSVNYPSFLMIDTIAKYIGKTKDADLSNTSTDEDLKDEPLILYLLPEFWARFINNARITRVLGSAHPHNK
jgi:ABC-type proline/glycine betaine transport system ATPase subunit